MVASAELNSASICESKLNGPDVEEDDDSERRWPWLFSLRRSSRSRGMSKLASWHRDALDRDVLLRGGGGSNADFRVSVGLISGIYFGLWLLVLFSSKKNEKRSLVSTQSRSSMSRWVAGGLSG